MKYIDISPPLSPALAVFPGDVPFSREISMDFKDGDHLGLSSIRTTLHIGAHTDAPNHYHRDGASIDQRDLHFYLGPCQVIETKSPRGVRLEAKDVKGFDITTPRVLFKTNSFLNPETWRGDFNSLSRGLVEFLKSRGVILVGIDTPSIDPAADKILESHQAVFAADMAVLEGIDLSLVTPGKYKLIALPLRIAGGDASPVRAVLVDEKEDLA